MTIGRKLMVAMTALLLACIGMAVCALYGLAEIGRELDASTTVTADKLALAGNLKAAANILRTGQRGILLNGFQHDAKASQATIREYAKRKQSALALSARLAPLLVDPEGRRLISQLNTDMEAHAASFARIADLCASGKLQEASAFYKVSGGPAGAAMEQAASEIMTLQMNRMRELAAAGRRHVRVAQLGMASISAFGIGSMVFTWFLVAGITRSLRGVSSHLDEGASEVLSASMQVAESSQKLAQDASTGAAAIEQTSAAALEVVSMVRKSAEQARTAADLMETVEASVKQGNSTLAEMAGSMLGITESSGKISRIIQVIDEIAFQTNILALNAAVEAARAGELGAGFSVVADEVRNLAQRSAQAARDSAGLIEDSITRSNDGRAKLQRVAEVIHGITENITRVKVFIDEVSSASVDEVKGVDQISKGVTQMESAAQSTASFSEQSAAASEQMSAQAQTLRRMAQQIGSLVGAHETAR